MRVHTVSVQPMRWGARISFKSYFSGAALSLRPHSQGLDGPVDFDDLVEACQQIFQVLLGNSAFVRVPGVAQVSATQATRFAMHWTGKDEVGAARG